MAGFLMLSDTARWRRGVGRDVLVHQLVGVVWQVIKQNEPRPTPLTAELPQIGGGEFHIVPLPKPGRGLCGAEKSMLHDAVPYWEITAPR